MFAIASIILAGMAGYAAVGAQDEAPYVVSHPTFKRFVATPNGQAVRISAVADIWHKTKDRHLAWKVTIRKAGKPVFEQTYDDQQFTVAKGVRVNPTFNELINMAPGTYSVTLGVYYYGYDPFKKTSFEGIGPPMLVDSEIVTVR